MRTAMNEPIWIYVVDDDDALRTSLVEVITIRTTWKVKAFSDGQSWLDAEASETRGCLLLDNMMPGKSGLAVLEEMRLRKSGHQIVMLSEESESVRAMWESTIDFVEKPLRFRDLERAITGAIERLI
jgi:FixJ family two-component response regulator